MSRAWPVIRLGSLYDVRDERAGDNWHDLTLMSVSQVQGVMPRSTLMGDGGRAEDLSTYKVCKPGDIVLNRMSAHKGALGVAKEEGLISPDYLVMKPRPQGQAEFLAAWLKTPRGVHEMTLRLRGIGSPDVAQVRTPRLNESELRGISIALPSPSEQRAIAGFLDREPARIDTLIEEQQRLTELLRERRLSVVRHLVKPKSGWTSYRIKHVASTQLGKMLDAGRAIGPDQEMVAYVRAADVRADGSVNLTDLNEMPFSDEELAHFDLRNDDLLVIEGGATVGRPALLRGDAPGISFQKTVNRVRVRSYVEPRFLYWSMVALYESGYYLQYYGSVSFIHLTGEKLREISITLPSTQEQQRIVATLDRETARIRALIAETERFIELSSERRSALITAAVTGQIDVRGAVS